MGQNLTGQTIASTYEDLVQISGSVFTDGLGNDITSVTITASNAISASYAATATSATSAVTATSASHALNADTAISSSYALTASFALNAGGADTGSLMVTGSVSSNTLTFTKGDGSQFSLTVNTGSAVTVDTGSLMVTGSVSLNTLTFTKGDGSTFDLTVNTGSAVTVNTGSLLVTASISDATTTYTKGDGSTFALVTNNVQNASTASLAATASMAITGEVVATGGGGGDYYITMMDSNGVDGNYEFRQTVSGDGALTYNDTAGGETLKTRFFQGDLIGNADTATSASHAINANNAISASFAQTASFAFNAATASYLETGFYATASFSGSTWTFNHNLNESYVVIECYDANNEEIIPQTIDLTSSNQAVITFPVIVEGVALASLGNGIVTGLDPISIYSQGQSQSSTVRTQTLIVDTAAVYNIHISQSGNHLVDVTGLASGTGASLNMYFYPESFTNVGDQAFMTFLIGSGSGNALTIKSLVSASAGFGYFMSGITIGSATSNLSRQASVQSKLFGILGTVPTIMTKTIDGIYFGSNNAPIVASSYIQSGSQGTPI
jgi:hypothetical protein